MSINQFMSKGTLNIFTDASIYEDGGIVYGCPGYCCVVTDEKGNNTIIDKGYTIIQDSSNNESELYAILMGVRKGAELRSQFNTVNLFSDSRISILTLKEWIFNWYKIKRKEDLLINTSGKEVKNQNVILEIIHTICNNNLDINLYHQKGHVNIASLEPVDNAKKVFKDSNNVLITTEEVTKLSNYNNYIDNYTRDNLKNTLFDKNSNYEYLSVKGNIIHFKSTFNINKYKSLVNYQ